MINHNMNSYLNTPLQMPLPILSPFFTAKQSFQSPFISPYAGPQDNYHNVQDLPLSQNDFDNFQLDQPKEAQVQYQSELYQLQSIKRPKEPQQNIQPDQDSDDQSIQSEQDCETSQKIKRIINLLVKHVDKGDEKLNYEKSKCVADDKELGEVFDVLVKKFRKLKKTKEEMTKYCMRKAFKFLAQKHKKILQNKDTGDFLRQYFQHMESEAFSIPFKKNSQQKTMNTNFLKKVFSSMTFVSDYKQFLRSFSKLVEQDNNKKVKYLTSTIKSYLNGHTLKKLQTVKRLPWTQSILDKTIDLASKLITHSPFYSNEENQEKTRKLSKQKNYSEVSTSTRRKSTTSMVESPTSPPRTQKIVKKLD